MSAVAGNLKSPQWPEFQVFIDLSHAYRRHPPTQLMRVAANVVCFCSLIAMTVAAGQTDVAFLSTRRSDPGVHIVQMVNGLESKAKVK